MTPSCMQTKLSLYSNNISYVSILVCQNQKRLGVSVHIAHLDAVVLGSGRILEARVSLSPSPQRSLSVSSRTRPSFQSPRAASPSPSSPRSIITFLVSAKPPEAWLLRLLFLVFASKVFFMFLYSLLESAANAVLKLISAVIAIANVLFLSIKSLSVNVMLLEYSFGKLKYDSTTLPMSGFLGSSRSPVSLAILNFFK